MQPSKRDVILPLTLLMSVSSLSVSLSLSLSQSLSFPTVSCLASNTVCPACSRETCPLSPLLLHSHRQPHSLGRLSVNLTEKKKKRSGADTDGSIILKLAENKVELKSGLKRGPQMNRSACHLVSLSLSVCVVHCFLGVWRHRNRKR